MNLRFIGAFTWYYGINSISRGPSYVLSAMLYPLVFLFLITIFSAGKLIDFAVLGGFLSIIATNAIYGSADAAFQRIQLKIQDLFVATSLTPFDYTFGLTFSYLATALPGLLIYGIIGALLGIFSALPLLAFVGIMLLLLVAAMSIAVIITGLIKHVRNLWGVISIVSVVLTMVPPSFYPYVILPKWALYLLMISPVTPAAMLSQGLFGLEKMPLYALPVLLFETAAYFAIAMRMSGWREK
ncbi:MAG: ABC transporter permease [Candidatus Marsarchaeota archaeon]|nr:ABC transporter permease [Candidatus Marsarchaeota archaeon]MCL5112656.1 ABC transporter permease [Candidatus Marsarchaeota archaeon]